MAITTTIGIDLGKSSFHAIGHDLSGKETFRKKLSRTKLLQMLSVHEPVNVAMESCGGSHWLARKCKSYGHTVKLIPAQYVKPYVKTNKNDFIDADAIAEASTRPSMRFTSPKAEEAQVASMVRKVRSSFMKERTACMNRIGAMLLEFGLSLPRGHSHLKKLFAWIELQNEVLPNSLVCELKTQVEYYQYLSEKIELQEKKLRLINKENIRYHLLQTIPGVGPLTAACCVANVADPKDFSNGRNFAAWIGLVPHQHSTGGKSRMLGISKRGNSDLRELFIHAARSILKKTETAEKHFGEWVVNLKRKKPFNVVVVALANKLARIAWSVMVTNKEFSLKI
ncbi:IS110 family transposase [Vibrio sp. 10N.286.45.C10]|uniref:IS110 family transposase n=1 Tax=unclassified Vibrio TaxID=2614977 RepID=UPI003551E08A